MAVKIHFGCRNAKRQLCARTIVRIFQRKQFFAVAISLPRLCVCVTLGKDNYFPAAMVAEREVIVVPRITGFALMIDCVLTVNGGASSPRVYSSCFLARRRSSLFNPFDRVARLVDGARPANTSSARCVASGGSKCQFRERRETTKENERERESAGRRGG